MCDSGNDRGDLILELYHLQILNVLDFHCLCLVLDLPNLQRFKHMLKQFIYFKFICGLLEFYVSGSIFK